MTEELDVKRRGKPGYTAPDVVPLGELVRAEGNCMTGSGEQAFCQMNGSGATDCTTYGNAAPLSCTSGYNGGTFNRCVLPGSSAIM
jgi:hypothetical protein